MLVCTELHFLRYCPFLRKLKLLCLIVSWPKSFEKWRKDFIVDYEFKNIESLIGDAIDSVINSRSTFKEQFAKIITIFSEAKNRASRSFLFDQPIRLTRLVQFHQQSLINFSDELTERTYSGDDPQLIEMITFFCDQLEALLKFLQKQFPEHFNLDFKVSEFLKTKSLQSLKRAADQINLNGSKAQINQTLLTISVGPIREFLAESESAISQRALTFTIKLSEGLNQIIQSDQESSLKDERVLSVLLILNYNSNACFEYYIDHLKSKLSEEDAASHRLEKLAFSYKVINQTQVKLGLAYDFQASSLKDQLSDWLMEEIQYLERTRELSTRSVLKEAEFVKTEFKLEFNMSVSQFAYFIKAFVESGLIQNKNISELMRFFTKFVKSRKSQSIGYESLHAKYYNVENSTKDSVKNLLHATIGYINSN